MGVVWAGNDREQQRPYAIKLLRSGGDTGERKQLLERARAAIALRHPNVLPVREVGSDGNRDFVAMELVEGECVADWLAGLPSQREVLEVMQKAGRALEAAHRAGVIHRNFKLHNVLRDREGHVRVADFGQARGQLIGRGERTLSAQAVAAGNDLGGDRPPPRNQDAVLDAALSQNGVYVGTPATLALELWRGMPPDERSDQFAFCVAVWEALTGTRPFTGETLEALEQSVAAGVPASAGSALPPGVRAALVRGLDPEATRRWPSMPALLAALEQAGQAAPSPRSRTLMIAAAGAVALGSLVTIFLLLRGGDSGQPVVLPVEADPPVAGGAAAATGAAGQACAPPAEAFGEVWTADRRARLEALRGSDQEVAKALAQLDDVRLRWTEAYSQACAHEDAAGSQRSRACLMLARDRAGLAVAQLESDGDVAGVAGLQAAIAACQ